MLCSGVDLIEVARVAAAVERHGLRFLRRVFTTAEQAYCAGDARRLAGRFAVKEAVAKALGTGIGDVAWTEIEIICDDRGRPRLELHGGARALAQAGGWDHWSISLAHTEEHAIGFAVAMQKLED